MKNSKAICTEIEGLMPLFVGGDLEQADAQVVELHVETCATCNLALVRAHAARTELRWGLNDLVDGREPQLWPALREQLQREGLVGNGRRRAGSWMPRILGYGSTVAACLALVFVLSNDTVEVGDAGSAPVLVDRGEETGGHGTVTPPAATSGFLAQGQPSTLIAPTAIDHPGLVPMGLGEMPLYNLARDAQLNEQRTRALTPVFLTLPSPTEDQGDLASGFSFQ